MNSKDIRKSRKFKQSIRNSALFGCTVACESLCSYCQNEANGIFWDWWVWWDENEVTRSDDDFLEKPVGF